MARASAFATSIAGKGRSTRRGGTRGAASTSGRSHVSSACVTFGRIVARRDLRPGQQRHGDDGAVVDDEERARRPRRQRRVVRGDDEAGEVVGHDEARPRGELRHDASRLVRCARQEEGVCDSPLGEAPGRVACALEHEAVEAVARVRVVRPERLVDEAGDAELVGALDGERERRVVVGPSVRLHPVQDEVAPRGHGPVVEAAQARVGGAEREGIDRLSPRPSARGGLRLRGNHGLAVRRGRLGLRREQVRDGDRQEVEADEREAHGELARHLRARA